MTTDTSNAATSGIHAVLRELNFELMIGPIATDDYLVVRCEARGIYGGGFPGAAEDAVGREVVFTGTDTLRVVDGMLAEYWGNADSLLFVQQLGVKEVPGSRA
jgi:hypothetical protein